MHLVDPDEKWQWAARGAQGIGDRFDQSQERGTGYAYYMPQMTQDQFHMVSSPRVSRGCATRVVGGCFVDAHSVFLAVDKELTRDV